MLNKFIQLGNVFWLIIPPQVLANHRLQQALFHVQWECTVCVVIELGTGN